MYWVEFSSRDMCYFDILVAATWVGPEIAVVGRHNMDYRHPSLNLDLIKNAWGKSASKIKYITKVLMD